MKIIRLLAYLYATIGALYIVLFAIAFFIGMIAVFLVG